MSNRRANRQAPQRETVTARWWEQPLRIIQLNLIVPDAARDGAQMARRAHEYGANALLINAGGIYAFYPTEVPFHHRAPGLSGDLLGDAIRTGHDRGMRVIVRYDLIGLHRDAYEAHPEWFYRSHDGRPMIDKGLYMTCPNGGWWQERFFALWDELSARYDVDGLFFNAWGHKEATREGDYFGPCHCATCTALFRERYGRALPAGRDPADPTTWLNRQFRQETLDDLGRRIYHYVKDRHPNVALFAGAGHRALATGQADCTEIELHCGSTSSPTGNRWRHAAGESCKQVASLGPGFASGINAVYCHVGPGRWRLTAAPPGWLGYTLAQTLANAGWPYCMMIGTLDTQPDRTGLPTLRDVLTFARDYEDVYRGLSSVAAVALLWSQRTASPGPDRREVTDHYVKHFRGWYDLLTRRHRLFDVISDTQLEGEGSGFPGQLSPAALRERFGLVIAPHPARLSAEACTTLDEFVRLGGALIVTGAPPLGEQGFTSLAATAITATRERVSNSYFRVPNADRARNGGALSFSDGALAALDLLPVEGQIWQVATRPGASAQLHLMPPEDYGAPEQTYFEIETEHPGLLWQRHGPGRTVYLPWEPDRAWFDTGVEALGVFLGSLVDHLAPAAPVECDAPEAVELTAHRQARTGRLVIHLVNGSGLAPPRWAEPVPLHGVKVRIQWEGPAPTVHALRLGQTLPVVPNGPIVAAGPAGYECTLPPLGLFEVLMVEEGTSGNGGDTPFGSG